MVPLDWLGEALVFVILTEIVVPIQGSGGPVTPMSTTAVSVQPQEFLATTR